jgi:hypothetical protein
MGATFSAMMHAEKQKAPAVEAAESGSVDENERHEPLFHEADVKEEPVRQDTKHGTHPARSHFPTTAT